jgi:hypothetical protein
MALDRSLVALVEQAPEKTKSTAEHIEILQRLIKCSPLNAEDNILSAENLYKFMVSLAQLYRDQALQAARQVSPDDINCSLLLLLAHIKTHPHENVIALCCELLNESLPQNIARIIENKLVLHINQMVESDLFTLEKKIALFCQLASRYEKLALEMNNGMLVTLERFIVDNETNPSKVFRSLFNLLLTPKKRVAFPLLSEVDKYREMEVKDFLKKYVENYCTGRPDGAKILEHMLPSILLTTPLADMPTLLNEIKAIIEKHQKTLSYPDITLRSNSFFKNPDIIAASKERSKIIQRKAQQEPLEEQQKALPITPIRKNT